MSKPGSAASEFVEFEVVEERGRKGLRVRREVSISFLTCLVVQRYFFGARSEWVVARLRVCLGFEVLDNYFGEWLKLKEVGEKRKRKKLRA